MIRSVKVRVRFDGDDDVGEASLVFQDSLERALGVIRDDDVIRAFEVTW